MYHHHAHGNVISIYPTEVTCDIKKALPTLCCSETFVRNNTAVITSRHPRCCRDLERGRGVAENTAIREGDRSRLVTGFSTSSGLSMFPKWISNES